MKIIRQIDVFDNQTEELVDEILVENFHLEKIKPYFKIEPDDSKMYRPYEITEVTVHLFPDIQFDFDNFSYFMACFQA